MINLTKFKPKNIALSMIYRGFFSFLPDKAFLKLRYRVTFGKKLNIKNPQTFNEKLQWLKLHEHDDKLIELVDKAKVKDFVSKTIGKEYVIETYGVYGNFDAINFDLLPDKFVLKCTHDSGSIYICDDKTKLDKKKAKSILSKGLRKNYFAIGREWPYKHAERKIIAEKLLVDQSTNEIRDYKIFCFNGVAQFFKIDFDRFINHRANYYDTNCNLLPFGEVAYLPDFEKQLDIPKNIKKMISLAESLAKGFKFVRVDFYSIDNRIYFGELTFYPTSGFGEFTIDEWDEKIGNMLLI